MKEKISISLDKQILSQLDHLIDHRMIRNRSQAIEWILQSHLSVNLPSKAVLLGGKLEQSSPALEYLAHFLLQLKKAEISELIVAGGKATEKIFNEIQKDSFFSKKSVFLREDKPLGTAGAVKLAANYLSSTFVVAYLDVRFEFDLKQMIETHKQSRAVATMALTYRNKSDLPNYVRIQGDRITEYEYKSGRKTPLANAAVYVFEPLLLEEFPSKGSLEEDVLPLLAREGRLKAFLFDTPWEHME